MEVEIIIKNYRCFPDTKPAKIILRNGFTAFLGVNNSGKSSLLKFFFEFRNIFSMLTRPNSYLIEALKGNNQELRYPSSIFDSNEVFCNTNNRDIEIQFHFINLDSIYQESISLIPKRLDIIIPREKQNNGWFTKLYLSDGKFIFNGQSLGFNGTILYNDAIQIAQFEPVIQIFKALSNTLYLGPFRNAINVGSKENYFDISVGEDFIKKWRSLKTGNNRGQNEASYKLTEDIKNIFGFSALEINSSHNEETLQFFINGKSYMLPELGSGITQFILVLANVAVRTPSFILIDEPELNLHPSLQLDFITSLASYASEGLIFATHSIGLARSSADCIYSLNKINEGESEVVDFENTPSLPEFLGELSFSGYRELGFNKILLVEGRTEVKTIQQFLRKYKKDHNIVLLPLGGDSFINNSSEAELGEIMRISDDVHALIDSERSTEGAELLPSREGFKQTCEKIGINCHVLERRATENYFTDVAVKKAKGDNYQALEHFQKIEELSPSWSKTENWRIAREMTVDDLNSTDIGQFLKAL